MLRVRVRCRRRGGREDTVRHEEGLTLTLTITLTITLTLTLIGGCEGTSS